MALWGEGDPRWIVEEREDAKNVNNWHWTEKNATQWSKDKITKLLVGTVIENDKFFCEITELEKIEGEAIANNRKAKLIFFYELVLEGKWKGHLKQGENKTKFKGKFDVPNLSEEFEAHEIDVNVSVKQSSSDADKLKDFMRKTGAEAIRERLAMYISELKSEYGKNLILPTKKIDPLVESRVQSHEPANQENTVKQEMNKHVVNAKSSGDCDKLVELKLHDEFFCTPSDLYHALITQETLRAFTRSESISDAQAGGKFSLFGGTITGQYIELNPTSNDNMNIKLNWRHSSWANSAHYSTVSIDLQSCSGGTELKLRQSNVPQKHLETTKHGWKMNYFAAIKQTFGYGGRMF